MMIKFSTIFILQKFGKLSFLTFVRHDGKIIPNLSIIVQASVHDRRKMGKHHDLITKISVLKQIWQVVSDIPLISGVLLTSF